MNLLIIKPGLLNLIRVELGQIFYLKSKLMSSIKQLNLFRIKLFRNPFHCGGICASGTIRIPEREVNALKRMLIDQNGFQNMR